MIKKIFIYWGQKFENAPKIVTNCLLSWKIKNPTWEIIELDDDNLFTYVDFEEIINIKNKSISKTAYSDIIRIFLLDKYGGCWCDATTFCMQPLDSWLNKYISSGFFAFDKPYKDRLLSSWFLYSEQNNYIISKWKDATINYWNTKNEPHTYLWFHYLFGDLYNKNDKFKQLWDLTPKLSADGPHFLQFNDLLSIPSDKVLEHMNNDTPMYKLTYKFDITKYRNTCTLGCLYNKINLSLIHIGKCGGTTIVENFKLKEYHLNRNYSQDELYILWLRNPLKRFVSAFNFSHALINYDTSSLNISNLTLNNCLAPARIITKIANGFTFSPKYDYLVNYFKTPNNLAESITSDEKTIRENAFELMNSDIEHIHRGIGWYLYNGKFIEENYNKIIFVGSIENMECDLAKLSKLLNIKVSKPKVRENKNIMDTYLSEKAINNLLEFYKDSDYKALRKMVDLKLISDELFKSYFIYN